MLVLFLIDLAFAQGVGTAAPTSTAARRKKAPLVEATLSNMRGAGL